MSAVPDEAHAGLAERVDFVYTGHPARIIFGAGRLGVVREEVERLGRHRVLLLAGPVLRPVGDRVAELLGRLCVGRFDGAVMHTPVAVTEDALRVLRAVEADCVVAVGGGSTTGLAKALAARTDVDLVIVPTTYAGSEVTPVLGETADGRKTTRSTPAVLPETVIYDVELSQHMPVAMSVTSAVNALAHAVEAMYAPQANPAVTSWALESARALATGLRGLIVTPFAEPVRTDLLRGAWLAGMCLGSVGMALHHKLCHTLGGSFGLPHAETHTVVLPHAMAYNAVAVPAVMDALAAAMNVDDAPAGVWDLVARSGGPTSLETLGMAVEDLAPAAELATAASYPNPRPVTPAGVRALLDDAWRGRRPEGPPAGP
ncbi:maleylacetate reductase [Mycolicibacterium sp.]|uniref:maleylacetate reductase n=1 Tax=Mycolicibacterium sp. TaxID=2320850 RepID=UPI003D124FDE